MGSFNVACSLTNQIIGPEDDAVMVFLTHGMYRSLTNPYSMFAVIPMIFEGQYDSYGNIENVKLFQSQETLDEKQSKAALSNIFTDLKMKTTGSYNGLIKSSEPENFDELLKGQDLSLIKQNVTTNLKLSMLKILKDKPELFESDTLKDILKIYALTHVKTIQAAEEEIKKITTQNELSQIKIPLFKMFFKKEAFFKLVQEYGVGDNDENHYISHLREVKNTDLMTNPSMNEIFKVITGTGEYAGQNQPAYHYQNIELETIDVSEKKDLKKISYAHALDITIVNDYFNVLGKTWNPNIYVSEDMKHYGNAEALEMQKSLLNDNTNSKKLKIK